MLWHLFEFFVRERAKTALSGEEHLTRQQLYFSSCPMSLLQPIEITTEGQSLRMLVDYSFHPWKPIQHMHVYIYTCKERWIWLLGIPELPAVRCILLTLCQSRAQEMWSLWRCKHSQIVRVLCLWLGAALRSPSALCAAHHSQEEWNLADSKDCDSSCENLALVKVKPCLLCCVVVKYKKPTHPPKETNPKEGKT